MTQRAVNAKHFKNLVDLMDFFKDEEFCHNFLKNLFWGENRENKKCPNCQSCNVIEFADFKKNRCQTCKFEFSIRKNTIFDDSKVPLRKWFMVIYLANSNKKGVNSLTVARQVGITQKTAWFMLHRIREVMKGGNSPFDGITEVDEAYFGGKEGNKHTINKFKSEKTAVIGLVNRDTKQVKAVSIPNADKENLLPKIGCNVAMGSTVITDTYNAYKNLKNNFKHYTIKHSENETVGSRIKLKNTEIMSEYVRLDSRIAFKIHTNTIEGFWSQVKRGIYGIYHWASKKHINRYLNEYTFRYNGKENCDFKNFVNWFSNCEGKKVVYANLIK
jgi:transposase-like protein